VEEGEEKEVVEALIMQVPFQAPSFDWVYWVVLLLVVITILALIAEEFLKRMFSTSYRRSRYRRK